MSKECHVFDHPSDIGLQASADTQDELMEALAEGLADCICDRQQVRPTEHRTLEVSAEDPEVLAVDFLSIVMNLIQVRRFMVASAAVQMKGTLSAVTQLAGEPYDPARHEIKTEIKAVTYHQLRIAQEAGGWVGRVILDI